MTVTTLTVGPASQFTNVFARVTSRWSSPAVVKSYAGPAISGLLSRVDGRRIKAMSSDVDC
ncbi:hypothetical protein OG948_55560 (plasmid) [Embleya sp. NBC_00888]|uniref:hypothetical protein n=1 Tax=Embleya sp. NBC_00888 TaxID=2975960 RepID=UPI002F9129AE|nr:hypothetical protein OG948_55560 [Embleya sp. NBC_00888]